MTNPTEPDNPQTVQELASCMKFSESYLYAVRKQMKQSGRGWVGGREYRHVVEAWLRSNPDFRVRVVYSRRQRTENRDQ